MNEKKGKGTKLIGAVFAFVLVCLFVFLNVNNIMKIISPESYLNRAISNTKKNLDLFNEQSGTPLQRDISVKATDIGGNLDTVYTDLFKGFSLSLQTQRDDVSKITDVKLSVASEKFEFADNELYVSPDIVAVKAPFLYNRHEYITSDPKEFREELQKIAVKLTEKMIFSNAGKTETVINKQTVRMSKMSYTVPAETVNEAYRELITLIEKQSGGSLGLLGSVNFTNDVSVDFYINNRHQVVKVEIDNINISVYNEFYMQERTASFSVYAELFGGKSLADEFTLSLNGKSGTDDYTIAYSKKSVSDGDTVNENNLITFKNGNIIMAKLVLNTDFKPNTDSEDNYTAKLTLSLGFSQMVADLTGSLTEKPIEAVGAPDTTGSIDFHDAFK